MTRTEHLIIFTKAQLITNTNPKLAGFAYNQGGGLFSKNAYDFYLHTGFGDNNHKIYQDIGVMFGGKKWVDNTPEAKGKAELAAIVAGPAVGITRSSCAEVVHDVEFGESDGAVCMYYFHDLKSGRVFRLLEDEKAWLSLGVWNSGHAGAARNAVIYAAKFLRANRLANAVRPLLAQRLQGGR